MDEDLEIFLAAPPGLEPVLAEEAAEAGFAPAAAEPGGVTVRGDWAEVWRANLALRGAARVLVRIAAFRAVHPAQLDKRARRVDWRAVLRPDQPVRVEATCRRSRIYHAGAAAERVARGLAAAGVPLATGAGGAADADDGPLRLLVRIEDDLCTVSLDSSGAPLHRRGHKAAVGKAPLRETLAAAFLRRAGYRGTEPVVDPMCGSGTFVLEAAEIALGLMPGRSRRFAFERLAGFDPAAWAALRARPPRPRAAATPAFAGHDRDAGAIAASRANAERAGIAGAVAFSRQAVGDLAPPPGPPGLVVANPPYGGRIGGGRRLEPVYGALGQTLRARFPGWRVALVTGAPALARATGLPFLPPDPPVDHGGVKVRLYRTEPLP